jgi:hypothetical protein
MELSAGAFVLSIDALTAGVGVDVDGAFETWGIARVRSLEDAMDGCDGREFVHGCEVVDAMRCDAMRYPPRHCRTNNTRTKEQQQW